jgi:hypothetical protein
MKIWEKQQAFTFFTLVVLFIFGCKGLTQSDQKRSQGNLPIRVLNVKVEVSQRQELSKQLQKFAEKQGFSILIREVRVIPDGIFIDMRRGDFEINAVSDAGDPTLLDFGFYEKDPDDPTPQDVVDDLFNELKNFLNEIPNITIIEEE